MQIDLPKIGRTLMWKTEKIHTSLILDNSSEALTLSKHMHSLIDAFYTFKYVRDVRLDRQVACHVFLY
jgi:hypothetical protein